MFELKRQAVTDLRVRKTSERVGIYLAFARLWGIFQLEGIGEHRYMQGAATCGHSDGYERVQCFCLLRLKKFFQFLFTVFISFIQLSTSHNYL